VLHAARGVEIRSAAIAKITVREGRATGVVLASGEELDAGLVVSGAHPRRTLLELCDTGWLDPEFVRAVRNLRGRGVVARIALRLDRAAELPPLLHAPSLDALERAYDDAKHGRISRDPYMEAHCAGETMEIDLQYAPFDLEEGWSDARRRELGETAAAFAARAAPGLAVRQASVLAPPDLEAQLGWPQGQADHAELALDQALWARPLPALARYRTPVEGLWLCGSAMHPGAGILGAAGYHCVNEIVRG
jgi:phytoene dehydrogenase-like protein